MIRQAKRTMLLSVVLLLWMPVASLAYSIDLDYSKDFSIAGAFATVEGWVDGSDDSLFHFRVALANNLSTVLNGGNNFGMDKFYFNTDLTLTAGMFTFLNPNGWQVSFDKNVAGYGAFSVETKGTGNSRTDLLHFTIDYTSTVMETNFLFTSTGNAGNGHGQFAAHIGGFDYAGVGSTFVRDGTQPPAPVPESSTVLLLGGGLVGLALYRRRKNNQFKP